MSNEEKNGGEDTATHTDITLSYRGVSHFDREEQGGRLSLFGDIQRDPVILNGRLKHPLKLREALATLYAIVGSDFSYVPKDRSAYQAYRRMRNESATQGVWQAQQAYFAWLQRNDPLAFLILDPVVSVHPDQVFLEVFSKDEGTYAKLDIDLSEIELEGDIHCGTTNIDFSEALHTGIQQFRDYRQTHIGIGQTAVKVAVERQDEVLEKKIKLPDSWLRGFLQVQSAAILAQECFSIDAMALYNLLRHLRLNRDKKGERRGLRVELVPGEQPRLVLEPWETLIECDSAVYRGKQAKVVRLWGRRRLMLLKRLLPFVERVDIHLMGSALPAFWVLRCGAITLTLGLTGFIASDWSQSASFDLLMARPRSGHPQENADLQKIIAHLSTCWFESFNGLKQVLGLNPAALREALQLGCQLGQLVYDIARDLYRLRPLTRQPLVWDRLEYRNRTDRIAHDLLARKQAVSIVGENRIHGEGVEITGKVIVKEDQRDYRPQLRLNEEGLLNRAECTCHHYRQKGLTAGPCAHLVALRLAWSELERRRRDDNKLRSGISMETRHYSRRDKRGEEVMRIALDNKQVNMRWGLAGSPLRLQRLRFNSVDRARTEYFRQLAQLQADGYLDASEG